MSESSMRLVKNEGQSLWYDNISRSIVRGGHLKRMIEEDGLGGVTSNPTIFMKAIAEGNDYDEDIRSLKSEGKSVEEVVHALTVGDIREAADVLRTVYDHTGGQDGYVSLEVNPHLAYDAEETIAEAVRTFREVNRPNLMIKVPGTTESAVAVRNLLAQGVNINVTLLFSPEQYRRVAEIYLEALEERAGASMPLSSVHSVASFFLSRIDTAVDRRLDEMAAGSAGEGKKHLTGLRGRTAVAVAKVTYGIFQELFFSKRFENLAGKGAAMQRPLWASTGTKDPAYPDVKYVESLIGPHTVNTLPQATMDAFRDHGRVARTILEGRDESHALLGEIASLGIDMNAIYQTLQEDGVKAFVDSFESLKETVKKKMV